MKTKLFLGLCLAAGLLTACHKKPVEIPVNKIEIEPAQCGALTTNITSVSYASDDLGSTYNLSSTAEHRRTETVILYARNRSFTPSRKTFLKLFPDKKDKIDSYLSTHHVDFECLDDVRALFSFVKES